MKRAIDAIRQAVRRFMRAVARGLDKATGGKLHPNAVTMFGLVMHVPIALLIVADYWIVAGILLIIFGLFDTLDGELARLQDRVTNNGGFLDASTDRMKEVLLYTGVAYSLALSDNPVHATWAVAACGASICVSYVKAKGEAVIAASGKKLPYPVLNKLFADGLLPFEIRMALLVAGLLSGYLVWIVTAIAVLSAYTALQRLARISKALS
ncbi:MAG TPA: CDP-alcohol phosphatidyltransferase family protein [Candidatus Saccharimonadales bacterium]